MSEPTSGENKSWPAVDVLSAHRLEGRARARLNAWYQMEEVARAKPPGVKPTADDRAAFARENPETGRELEALIANQRWALASGVVGSIGFGAHSLRHGGSAVFGLVGGILGGLVSGSVADNVVSWAYGTYTFDQLATTKIYRDWLRRRYSATSQDAAS